MHRATPMVCIVYKTNVVSTEDFFAFDKQEGVRVDWLVEAGLEMIFFVNSKILKNPIFVYYCKDLIS